MGYYADTSWDMEFPNQAAADACMAELARMDNVPLADAPFVTFFNENGDDDWTTDDATGRVTLWSTGTGKYYGEDSQFDVVAKHVTKGTMEVQGDGERAPDLFIFKDGKVQSYSGFVVFRTPEAKALLSEVLTQHGITPTDELISLIYVAIQ